MKNKKLFSHLLLSWHKNENKRIMPWKGVKDAYKIWLSEIILQQTRVEQGWKYYEKFIQAYPTITQLANAEDETVFKLWEGLGYYTRCKNLLHTARFVRDNYKGEFPAAYDTILSLKGIGNYTAAAIASFCFNLPYAVVDGNVFRVLSRFFGVEIATGSSAGKAFFLKLAQDCLAVNNSGEYNQSIMDFGATVCKRVPLCNQCPLQKNCIAFKTSKVDILPLKEKNIAKKERWFTYFVFSYNNKTFVRKRSANDIWQNLYEFHLEETQKNPEWNAQKAKRWLAQKHGIFLDSEVIIIPAKKQVLTHQVINGYFICAGLKTQPAQHVLNGSWLSKTALNKKAFPQFINQFIHKKILQLQAL